MKKFFMIVVLSLLTATIGFCKTVTPIESVHEAEYHIGFDTLTQSDMCSATAVGPNVLLTATHCELPTDEVIIQLKKEDDSEDNPDTAKIVRRIRDGADHTLLFITGQKFKNWVPVKLDDTFELGEDVFAIGNPGEYEDIFYKGYVQGIAEDNSLAATLGVPKPDKILFDFRIWHGVSGAGVFNSKGELIAVLSTIISVSADKESPVFSSSFKMAFTSDQIKEAVEFTAPGFVPAPKDVKIKADDDRDPKDKK